MYLRCLTSKTVSLAARNVLLSQTRNLPLPGNICSPPTYRMPFPQKVIIGTGMIMCMLAIPIWVSLNIKVYSPPPVVEMEED